MRQVDVWVRHFCDGSAEPDSSASEAEVIGFGRCSTGGPIRRRKRKPTSLHGVRLRAQHASETVLRPFANDARHEPHLPDIATPAVPNAPLNRLRLPRATENQRNVVPQKWVEARKNKWLAEKCRSLKTDDALRRQFANIGKCSMDV